MKLRTNKIEKLFFTSDTHWGHKNIIKYGERPFSDVHEMNNELIKRWNEVVPKDGIVFHLGDFAFRHKSPLKLYKSQLNGIINLCFGNHDSIKDVFKSGCFNEMADLYDLTIDDPEMDDGFQRITCCHYPMITWNHSHRGAWHFHGHTHQLQVSDNKATVNLCVENWDYRPVSYQQLKEFITKRYLRNDS